MSEESIFSTKVSGYQRRSLWKLTYYKIGLIICEGNIKRAAQFLGISEKTLYDARKRHKEIEELLEEGYMGCWESDWSTEKLREFKEHLHKGFKIHKCQEGSVLWLCEKEVKSTIDKVWFKRLDYDEQKRTIRRIRDLYLNGSYSEI